MSAIIDVNKLMRDLTVEQLIQFQTSLEQEIEKRKEDLRQMVGRRYRDLLDASNAVKRLTEIAGDLVEEIKNVQDASSLQKYIHLKSLQTPKRVSINHFILLNSLLPQIGHSEDSVSDVFCLLLANNFHKQFSAETYDDESAKISKSIYNRLIHIQTDLFDQIVDSLGHQMLDDQAVTTQLVALAFLKQYSMPQLLDSYLDARMRTIIQSLKQSNTSLIGIIRMMRDTTQMVDDIFGHGKNLILALQASTSLGWCPDAILSVIDDQIYGYADIINGEILKINAIFPSNYLIPLQIEEVEQKCTEWIAKMCEMASERVRTMCDHFEETKQIVEFVQAINQFFKSDWPSIPLNLSIYQRLFNDSLRQRFCNLIEKELEILQKDLILKFPTINCNSLPLFQKRTVKFDVLLASGVSHDLNELIQKMFEKIKEILSNTNKYANIGREENINSLNWALADSVLNLINRFIDYFEISKENGKKLPEIEADTNLTEAQTKWLARFRLFLTFVQHKPSIFCLCMNKDAEKIKKCNEILHSAAEISLCNYLGYVIHQSVIDSQLDLMPKICSKPNLWMNIVQKNLKLEIGESSASTLDFLPTQISSYFTNFLYLICRSVNNSSVGHLFTRNATIYVSNNIGEILSKNLKKCAEECISSSLICTQLLFDCKTLFIMFHKKGFAEAEQIIEPKLDPFILKLISTPISRNAKLFAQRTSMMFGQLQEEPLTASKDSTLLNSNYSVLIDITPKIEDIRRLTLIPRISKLKNEKEIGKGKNSEIPTNSTNKNFNPILTSGTTSISSLYGKISAGWFKN